MGEPQCTIILFKEKFDPKEVKPSKKLQYIVDGRNLELLFISHHIDSVTVHCRVLDHGRIYNGFGEAQARASWRDHQEVITLVDDRTISLSYRHHTHNFWQFVGIGKGEVTGETAHTGAYAFYSEFLIKNVDMRNWLIAYFPERVKDTLRYSQRTIGRRPFVRVWDRRNGEKEKPKPRIVLRHLAKQTDMICLSETNKLVTVSYSDCVPDPKNPLLIKEEEANLSEGDIATLLLSENEEIRTNVAIAVKRITKRKEIREELKLTN